MSGLVKIVANKDAYVSQFVYKLSPYLVNLGKSPLKNTILVDPHMSSMIGFEVVANRLYIGFPSELFDVMLEVRFFGVSYIHNHPAMFFVMDCGDEHNGRPLAMRFFVRESKVVALSKFSHCRIVRMEDDGTFDDGLVDNFFDLYIREEKGLVWEGI